MHTQMIGTVSTLTLYKGSVFVLNKILNWRSLMPFQKSVDEQNKWEGDLYLDSNVSITSGHAKAGI